MTDPLATLASLFQPLPAFPASYHSLSSVNHGFPSGPALTEPPASQLPCCRRKVLVARGGVPWDGLLVAQARSLNPLLRTQ